MIDLKLIGSRIRELRQKNGLTQNEFAKIISVSFQAVSNWERGIAPPDIENLVRIASHFGVLVDTLLSPAGEALYLGIDGGGTKTEFVAVASSGCIRKRMIKSGCNPNDIGYAAAEALIVEGINEILTEYPTIKGIFGGIAGMSVSTYSGTLCATLKKVCPQAKIQIFGDALNLFGFYDDVEMAVISGTGSVVFVKQGDRYQRIGGWGYLFERAGSGYDIGRDAVCLALGEEDSMKEPSLINQMLRKAMNTATVWEHINALHKGGKPYVASFASAVFDAYTAGDTAAIEIIDRNAQGLAEHLNMGIELYGCKPVAIASGGLFEHHADIMLPHIRAYSPVQLLLSDLPPIYGACRKACALDAIVCADDFFENFRRTYGEIKK